MLLAALLVATSAAPYPQVTKYTNSAALSAQLHGLGYQKRGGISQGAVHRNYPIVRAFPHFDSSFTAGGRSYPYTMVGYAPATGRTAKINVVIVPLRATFYDSNHNLLHTFDPSQAVHNIIASPMFQNASWPGPVSGTQFVDAMQRATFWNAMDVNHHWHVLMNPPSVMPTVDVEVTGETVGPYGIGQDSNGNWVGDVLIDFMDAQIQTILQVASIPADTLPIFVTQNVTAEALGYHSAAVTNYPDGGVGLSTYLWTSWFDLSVVGPLLADVSTLNHEMAEWANDPYVSNVVPTWKYPDYPTLQDPSSYCSGNPFLEVGDPQGNGPTYADFPTAVVNVGGYDYHLQQLVMLPWFTDEAPSSAYGGWYTFPLPQYISKPATYCQ